MNWWQNILAGVAQVAIPVIVMYGEQQGWWPTGGIATILATLGAGAASGLTTKVPLPKG